MQLSPQQEEAAARVCDWIHMGDPEQQVFRLFGYAGTGKTTLAKQLAEGVAGTVLFAAFTGKAAYVLRTKGCHNATTLHSLIYIPVDKSRQRLEEMQNQLIELEAAETPDDDAIAKLKRRIKKEKENVDSPGWVLNTESSLRDTSLLVIDEVSMVSEQMARDLLSFGTQVLVLGDPAQLPPVKGMGYFTEQEPNVLLTEIHRQAEGNPIIELATKLRHQQMPKKGNYGESRVVSKVNEEDLLEADQILVGRNRTRRSYNQLMRKLRGFPEKEILVPGDKVVCLRNNHQEGLLNGSLWTVLEVKKPKNPLLREIRIASEDDETVQTSVEVPVHRFQGEEEVPFHLRAFTEDFDFGYALTCHKAQGSQWGNVLIIDESDCFARSDRAMKWRWSYTAVTRAAERVTLVVP